MLSPRNAYRLFDLGVNVPASDASAFSLRIGETYTFCLIPPSMTRGDCSPAGRGDIGAVFAVCGPFGDFIGDGPALAGDRDFNESKNALISGTNTLL